MDLEATSLEQKLGPRTPLCPPCVFILCGESFNVRFKMFVLCVITVAGRSCGAELIKPACGGSSANETQCLEPFSRCSGGNAAWKHPVKTARKKKTPRGGTRWSSNQTTTPERLSWIVNVPFYGKKTSCFQEDPPRTPPYIWNESAAASGVNVG